MFALSPLVCWSINRFGIVTLLLAAGFWALESEPLLMVGGWPLLPGKAYFPFLVGAFIAIHRPFDLDKVATELAGRRLLLAGWIVLVALSTWSEGFQDFRGSEMGMACVGLIAAWCNYDLVRPILESRISRRFGQHFFFVFAAHEPFLVIPAKLFFRLAGDQSWYFPVVSVVLPIFTVLICFAIAELFKRFLDPVYFVLNGRRGG